MVVWISLVAVMVTSSQIRDILLKWRKKLLYSELIRKRVKKDFKVLGLSNWKDGAGSYGDRKAASGRSKIQFWKWWIQDAHEVK